MPRRAVASLIVVLVSAGCGGDAPAPAARDTARAPASGALSAFQQEHGIGPVTEAITLGPIDEGLAEQGEALFETKCSACHKLGERYVGPAVGDVLARRSPTFVMNMILNPQEMYERHPAVKQMLAEYMSYMPNQNLTRDEARAVVEYLRHENAE